MLPGDGRPFDFVYAPAGVELGSADLVEQYPLSGAGLFRPRAR